MAASDLNLAAVVGDHFAGWSPQMLDQLQRMFTSNQFMPFVDALARVGNCAHPIRLRGSSTRIDPATGEILSSYASSDEPLGVTYVRCGNRRASVCPACSRVYAADVFHLIRAGVTGGKTVPESVAENPLVFATLTAPSFGHVHSAQAWGRPVFAAPAIAATATRCIAWCATATTIPSWASRCASTATTTPPRLCGSGGRRTCGVGSPSRCGG
ncbi:MAG TPA: replication initiator [Mycobacterium sp.]|nr:replication initiator [Mycobacterium sp.]